MTDSSGVDWGMGINRTNPGNAFMQAYQQGQETRRQDQARQAMAKLVQNPSDPQALAALAEVDPSSAMQFRQQQFEYTKAQLAQHQDSILKGAQIVREINPTDQKGWDQARALAAQAGIDISQVPAEFNPQYVAGLSHLADAFKPEPQDPGIIREFDEATRRGLVPQGTTYTQYVQMRNPSMSSPVTIPYGAQVMGGGGGPSPDAIAYLRANPNLSAQFDQKYGAGAAAQILGGAGSPAPQPFPGHP